MVTKLTSIPGLKRPTSDFDIATHRPLGPDEYMAQLREQYRDYEAEVWFDSADE